MQFFFHNTDLYEHFKDDAFLLLSSIYLYILLFTWLKCGVTKKEIQNLGQFKV